MKKKVFFWFTSEAFCCCATQGMMDCRTLNSFSIWKSPWFLLSSTTRLSIGLSLLGVPRTLFLIFSSHILLIRRVVRNWSTEDFLGIIFSCPVTLWLSLAEPHTCRLLQRPDQRPPKWRKPRGRDGTHGIKFLPKIGRFFALKSTLWGEIQLHPGVGLHPQKEEPIHFLGGLLLRYA